MKGREGSPQLAGPPLPPLSPPGNSGPFLKVVVVTSYRVKTPSFQPHSPVLSCQEAKKVTNPKNAESQSEVEKESGGGVGRVTVARKEGRKGS